MMAGANVSNDVDVNAEESGGGLTASTLTEISS